MNDWQPDLYNRFRHYRAEPVEAILARLPIATDATIADLGCGPGDNTVELARRAKSGSVRGIDLSPAMIEAAEKLRATLPDDLRARVSFAVGDISHLALEHPVSIIFSNAALQWIPNHREVLALWVRALTPGGRMVVQMPANDHETAKVELAHLAREPEWAPSLGGIDQSFREIPPPEYYARILTDLGCVDVDCYYRVFHHSMREPGEVVEWYRSTGLRPFLSALEPNRHAEFLAAYRARLVRAYGTSGAMTFDFKRLFIWARRPGA